MVIGACVVNGQADLMVTLVILALAFWDTLEIVTRPLAGARIDLEGSDQSRRPVSPSGRFRKSRLRALIDGIHARHEISDGKRPNQLPNAEVNPRGYGDKEWPINLSS
ncbi:hypothetical protein JMJ77_0014743 [Colletotrichum scovillei]|uniref:Uncharacterized protein n=1 Tax=Colletotrichum scovillei TaxID=1209932 RepID=A0A9P7R1I7_9PEZI|nr:hypothetical protein JMJ77_0014743 [Colletotrichum scovillei]KAG7056352.1 hypothetical protein JMJ78_0000154 [Colletotrichum scovillei]KAG7066283.1 hypothetical protein JMJ76_0000148 [Colletotrichum scovillei]